MKKIIVFLACFCMFFPMTACSNNDAEEEKIKQEEAKQKEAEEKEKKEAKKEAKKKEDEAKEMFEQYAYTNLKDSIQAIRDTGYQVFYQYKNGSDCTSEYEFLDPSSEFMDGWIITELSGIDPNSKHVTLTIQTQDSIDAEQQRSMRTKALIAKLDLASAWNAVQDYGKTQYPNGFKLHYITGALAKEAVDENTWYLKAKATVKNENGEKIECDCEAHVTGTSEAPQVIDFLTY